MAARELLTRSRSILPRSLGRTFSDRSKPVPKEKKELPGFWDPDPSIKAKTRLRMSQTFYGYWLKQKYERERLGSAPVVKNKEEYFVPPEGPTQQKLISVAEHHFKKHSNKTKAQLYKTMWTVGRCETYGVPFALQKEIFEKVSALYPLMNRQGLVDALRNCYQMENREFQYLAQELAHKYFDVLCGQDDVTHKQALEDLKWMLTHEKSYSDTVDWISSKLLGKLELQCPDLVDPVLDSWVAGEHVWLRRAAILHQLHFGDKTNREVLFRYCLQCGNQKDFYTQKAIGMALKQYSQVNEEAVKDFVTSNERSLSKISQMMALK